MLDPADQPPSQQSPSAKISNLVVRLLHDYTGRGPTRARTLIDHDLITVVLHDTLTRGEQSLVLDDRADLVLEMRHAYQQTIRDEMIAGVQEVLGRKVIAFLSANHIDPDLAVETFLLEPQPVAAD
jgi:uncharacterized protein YbcI